MVAARRKPTYRADMTVVKSPIVQSRVFRLTLKTTPKEARIIGHQGGTWSGKTYSIMQALILKTISTVYTNKQGRIEPIETLVVGQDVPNLKRGAIGDFENVLQQFIDTFPPEAQHLFRFTYNKTDRIATFSNGSTIQFSSFTDAQSAKAGKRHFLFLNEANGISYDIAKQLMFRVKIQTILDYNPDAPFWYHELYMGKERVKTFYSNFTHNPSCPEDVIRDLKQLGRQNPEFAKVYVNGKTGSVQGVVFKNVRWVNTMPDKYQKESFGLDFGYTNDPTTLVRVVLSEGKLYAQALLYEPALDGEEVAKKIKKITFMDKGRLRKVNPKAYLWCDNGAPNSINLLKKGGFEKARGAQKWAGSVKDGCSLIKGYGTLSLINSMQWKAEQLGYQYEYNKATGTYSNEPDQTTGKDHLWDALRYAMEGIAGDVKRRATTR